MFLRRLYSSLPCPRHTNALPSHSSSHMPSPRPQTRGRIRPSRLSPVSGRIGRSLSAKQTAAKPIVARLHEGRGRRRPSSSSRLLSVDPFNLELLSDSLPRPPPAAPKLLPNGIPSAPRLLFTHPTPALNHVNEFRPIQLYPEQFKLHTTFTHPAHPLPLNLGTHIYTTPRQPSTTPIAEDLFSPPPPPNPARSLITPSRATANGLSDHFKVVTTLSHPSLVQHLGGFEPSLYFGGAAEGQELEFGGITGTLGYKSAELKEQNEKDWQAILTQFSPKPSSASTTTTTTAAKEAESDAELSEVVNSLNAMLSNLGMSSARGRRANVVRSLNSQMMEEDLGLGEETMQMDSTKRKRKKKISKHKYKKRRKATRALRKRLGK
ncbi:hypothetical protein IAR55_000588 [Kwoniella newhampshirensis]|uniref:Ribosomal protein mS38 C-terminal domain-containing protein n=1 Tax=Kwoniella newhampshirensis TaxID=1651941 RepID=A0AAW0Z702_9TREE